MLGEERGDAVELAAGILEHVGLVERQGELSRGPGFYRGDLTLQPVRHHCDCCARSGAEARLRSAGGARCRWDRIKDPIGVMRGFAEHTLPHAQAHLILAGPTVHTVTDDPEEPEMLDEVQAAWRALPHELRHRVTIACLPMHDVDENAAIVNALQRHADVIVKKSLEEGFGLGVSEALWKRRAVVASDVGGHRDQIRHQHSGLLVDPVDLRGFGTAIAELLADPDEPARSARPDTTSSITLYLDSRQLAEWDELLAALAETTTRDESASQPKLQIVRNRTDSGSPPELLRDDEGQNASA